TPVWTRSSVSVAAGGAGWRRERAGRRGRGIWIMVHMYRGRIKPAPARAAGSYNQPEPMPCPMSVLLAAGLLAAQAVKPPSYQSLVELYARGDRADAVAGLGFLSYNDAIQGYGALKAAAEQLARVYDPARAEAAKRAEELERLRGLMRAAVMLHWDRDDADRPPSV